MLPFQSQNGGNRRNAYVYGRCGGFFILCRFFSLRQPKPISISTSTQLGFIEKSAKNVEFFIGIGEIRTYSKQDRHRKKMPGLRRKESREQRKSYEKEERGFFEGNCQEQFFCCFSYMEALPVHDSLQLSAFLCGRNFGDDRAVLYRSCDQPCGIGEFLP